MKGALRSGTILFLAHVFLSNDIDLAALRPDLWRSMCFVACRRGSLLTDIASVAFTNAAESSKGAIRRAHCAVTWVAKLRMLQNKQYTPTETIKLWNDQCAKNQQLTGAKRAAVLNMLELPVEITDILVKHVSAFGSDSALTDETFSNKAILPGFSPKAFSKEWNQKLSVTIDGIRLLLSLVNDGGRICEEFASFFCIKKTQVNVCFRFCHSHC